MKPKSKTKVVRSFSFSMNQLVMIVVTLIFLLNITLTVRLHSMMNMNVSAATIDDIIPTGVPYYGKQLGVTYDDVVGSLSILAALDEYPDGPSKDVSWFDRYIKIGMMTSCEFCCSAKTLVFKNGAAACGCQHSKGMRGLLAWLLENSPEKSDQEILTEVNRWKALYFPKQTLKKAAELGENGDIDYERVLNEMKDAPDMVGGC
ncbi:MAG: hypothetical protein ACE5DX_04080 [Candidatus Dojkabacteria bacterium]